MAARIPKKRAVTSRELAKQIGCAPSSVRRFMAQPRDEWLAEQAERREAMRAYRFDEGHTCRETADHFGTTVGAVSSATNRAQKEAGLPPSSFREQQAERREAIRAFKYDEKHTWQETADHFGIERSVAFKLGNRAKRELESA